MKFIPLGSTSIHVSPIGLGTVKFGRNQAVKYPTSFELPSDKHILDLLAAAKDLGINLLDTAPSYGTSEERLGQLLKNRHEWILCSKAGEEFSDGESTYIFTPQHIQASVERSLKRLKTDYLDILLIHSDGEDMKVIQEFEVFDTLTTLKQKGLIRAFGMSTKTVDGGIETLKHSDVAMVTYNPIYTEEEAVIDYAQQHKKGIFIKKALASGHITKIPGSDPIQSAMDFIFAKPGVNSVIVGTLQIEHLKKNVLSAAQAVTNSLAS